MRTDIMHPQTRAWRPSQDHRNPSTARLRQLQRCRLQHRRHHWNSIARMDYDRKNCSGRNDRSDIMWNDVVQDGSRQTGTPLPSCPHWTVKGGRRWSCGRRATDGNRSPTMCWRHFAGRCHSGVLSTINCMLSGTKRDRRRTVSQLRVSNIDVPSLRLT